MSHHPANDQLSAFLDGELDDAEAAAVEAALEGDEGLRDELTQLKSVQRLLRTHGPARAPEGFAARVIAAAAEEDNVVAFPWWRRPFGVPVEGVLIAAAAALVLIVALPRGEAVDGNDPAPAVGIEREAPAKNSVAKDVPKDGTADDDAVADATDGQELALGAKGRGMGGGGTAEAKDAGATAPSPKEAPVLKKELVAPKPAPTKGATEGVGGLDAGTADNGATEAGGGTDGAEGVPFKGNGAGAADVEDPTMAASGVAIDLYSEDEDILRQLQVLASRHGGVLRDRAGNAIQVGILQADVTELDVDVPSDQASAFTKALSGLDAKVTSTGNSTLTAGPSIKLPIRIVWVKNGPPNARKTKSVETLEE